MGALGTRGWCLWEEGPPTRLEASAAAEHEAEDPFQAGDQCIIQVYYICIIKEGIFNYISVFSLSPYFCCRFCAAFYKPCILQRPRVNCSNVKGLGKFCGEFPNFAAIPKV